MNSEKHTAEEGMKGKHAAKGTGSVRDSVLAQISSNQVRMRSRTFFVLRIIGIIVLALAILALSIAIVNFLSFTFRVNGQGSLLRFGGQGILIFLQVFPWPLLILDFVFLFFLERLLRVFRFGYRSPVLYLFIGIVLVAAVSGVLLDRGTPLNDDLLHQADNGHLPPPLGALYQGSRHAPPPGSGVFRGTIASYTPPTALLNDPDLGTSTIPVMLPPSGFDKDGDHQPTFGVGDSIMVFGVEQNGVIQAHAIYPLDPDDIPPFNHFDHDGGH